MPRSIVSSRRREQLAEALLLVAAIVLVAMVARPYAGSWNDGSRLATVESLVDRHTWSIDNSIFVRVPHSPPLPYSQTDAALLVHGTQDKLFIQGHYYSDKSPVPALFLAGFYQLCQWTTGMTANSHPDRFCRAMTLASSGLAYVVAVWCIYRMGRRLRLCISTRLLLTSSFGLATVALPYARQVNNHILLLAVASAIAAEVAGLREAIRDDRISGRTWGKLGCLAGLGYTIDLGAGPVMLLGSFVLLLNCLISGEPQASGRSARLRLAAKPVASFILAAMPWLLLHHALNYSIGGTFKPANANPEYFRWPGSPFATENLTGRLIHPDLGSFLLYASSMIGGKRGFVGHNVPLYLSLAALMVLRRQRQMRSELLWAVACCVGTWLLYAATSNNSSGQCCSIRWFVPLLAPAYLVLALFLRHFPRFRIDLMLLSCWGLLLAFLMRDGPWMGGMVRFFWPIQAAALLTWAASRYLRSPALEHARQHPYTNSCGNSSLPGAAAFLLWKTTPSLSGARANTISATSTSTCPATSSSSSPA